MVNAAFSSSSREIDTTLDTCYGRGLPTRMIAIIMAMRLPAVGRFVYTVHNQRTRAALSGRHSRTSQSPRLPLEDPRTFLRARDSSIITLPTVTGGNNPISAPSTR